MAKKLSRFQRFREHAQALLDEHALPGDDTASRWRKFVHFWVLVWRSFVRNRCPVRASALAYATLLALIPMLAVVMSITSSFLKQEGEERIDEFIVKFVASVTPPALLSTNGVARPDRSASTAQAPAPPAEAAATPGVTNQLALPAFAQDPQAVDLRKKVARHIHDFIQNTRSGALGVTGSVLLIFAAISMLSRIETTFNDIWGVARGRSWFMRIVLYWGVISLAPLLLTVALGLATGPHLESTKALLATLPIVGGFIVGFGFQVLPIVVLCLTFSVFYMLMPNAKVHWRAALVGGLVSGFLFHVNSLLSVLSVSRVVSNSKIYGSLALVPVFMIGLYFGWLILLLGAQVAYAFQNRATYFEEKQVEHIHQRGREFISLRLMTLVGQRFVQGEPPPGIMELAEELGVPTRLIRQIMQTLAAARLVVEAAGTETAYLPARPVETITCHDILFAMRASQGQELATRDEPTRAEVYGEFQRIMEAERQAASAVTLQALVHRAYAQLPPGTMVLQVAPEAGRGAKELSS
ncbi:MAG TPA: YhjD/YihY/BrkB family envelope integrity protein [Bacillota bacterium]|nr:YhjD/YihY/BrkB family envelope integrity protein [Bacillota bacterium]